LNKHLAEIMGKYVYSFTISENAVWNTDNSEQDYNIDTIGSVDLNLSESGNSFDVFWDPEQFREGFQTIYVTNTSILEISSMSGGSVAGYSLPLGAKRRKKRKKKVYMEPHMHQD
jgi:hypothetical protein